MAAVSSYAGVAFTYPTSGRLSYEGIGMSEYVAGGSTVPDTTISDVTPIGLTRVRLYLAVSVPSDATWTTVGNYTVTPSGGASAVTVSSATPRGDFIDLVTSTHTASGSYSVAWTGLTGVTAGSDTYTPTALSLTGIKCGASAQHNTVTGNVCRNGTITYSAGTDTVEAGNVGFPLIA